MNRTIAIVAALSFAACSGTPEPMPAKCTTPTGAGTKHSTTITSNTVWTAAESPHIITYTPNVAEGATLTIEPCAVVQIEAGYGLQVQGRLEALGDAEHPIVITAADPAKPFSYVEVLGGFADLAYVTISNGGAASSNSNAMLDVWGKSTPQRTQNARLRHVSLTNSLQFGLTLERSGTLTDDSTAVVISGAKLGPIMVRGAALVGGIPAGTYTGNTINDIVVIARDFMAEDTTWHDRGVPYRIGDDNKNGADFRVGLSTGATLVTWTLEPGVKLRVTPEGSITFNGSSTATTGTLVARGTAANPIVFTSAAAAPKAGDWRGLVFTRAPAPTTAMDHLEVRYAGGPSQSNSFHCQSGSMGAFSSDEDAAIAFFGQPTQSMLTNSLLADSAADGVNLAYSGSQVDFVAANAFSNIARCKLTFPRLPTSNCPNPVPTCQ
jgi:hypothetical protein